VEGVWTIASSLTTTAFCFVVVFLRRIAPFCGTSSSAKHSCLMRRWLTSVDGTNGIIDPTCIP